MKDKTFKHLVAVYGTLRKNQSNNSVLGESKLLGAQTIPGYSMYSMIGYPAINKSDENFSIEIEVFEIDCPVVLRSVYRLEGYTGNRDDTKNWYDTLDVETKFGKAEIFYMKESLENKRTKIEDGIWRGAKW